MPGGARASERRWTDLLHQQFHDTGAMRAVAELGLCCPEDVAAAGIDDLPWTAGFRLRLTVVAQPARNMGREAAMRLFRSYRRAPNPLAWAANRGVRQLWLQCYRAGYLREILLRRSAF
jgi:hypothetical protein